MRLTCTEGGSNKFWEVTLEGNTLTVHWGKIGTAGQSKKKVFPDGAKARNELAKLVKEKLDKGYRGDNAEDATRTVRERPAAAPEDPLAQALARIDRLLPEGSEAKLRPGVNDAALEKLSATIFGGKPVPSELATWFRWHDGQQNHRSLYGNRMLMKLELTLSTWEFFATTKIPEVQPWKKSWLPLLENGAGDYLVYETKGPEKGSLIGYWHTDKDRKVEYKSLLEFVGCVGDALDPDTEPPAPTEPVPRESGPLELEIILRRLDFTKVESEPTLGLLADAPKGAVLHRRQLIYHENKLVGDEPWHFVWVKVAPDVWLEGWSWNGPRQAVDDVAVRIVRPSARHARGWKLSPAALLEELTSPAVHGGEKPSGNLSLSRLCVHGDQVPD
jgi:predicted DNA-binding WGR domain protein